MSHETTIQPRLTDLLVRFLNEQAQAQPHGLADSDPGPEVSPYDAGPVQPIDAKVAWEQAVAAAAYFEPGVDTTSWPAPPHWASLVADQEPAVAIAFCLGNFPQMVRNFHLILQQTNLSDLQLRAGRPMQVPALADWAQQVATKKQMPHMLLAVGCLRLARNFDVAETYLRTNEAQVPLEWRAAWTNEKAALAWHQGRTDVARALWNTMDQSIPVLFNRGMAELFLGNTALGRRALSEVALKLPEHGAWHHLARLYLLLGPSS
jgi:hypothetical protein